MNARALAKAVRRERTRAGLTQKELADLAGTSLATIGALERGEREDFHPRTLTGIDEALGRESGWAYTVLNESEAVPFVLHEHLVATLCSIAESLDDEGLETLIAEAQRLRNGEPERFFLSGRLTERVESTLPGLALIHARVEGPGGKAWAMHQSGPRGRGLQVGDELTLDVLVLHPRQVNAS